MAWTESGLFYPTMRDLLKGSLTSVNWLTLTNKISLVSNAATPDFFGSTDPSTWTNASEVAGTGWVTGGIAFSAAAAGATSIAPAFSHTTTGGTNAVLAYSATNVSVATTTVTGAFGAYLYAAAQSPAAMFLGIWFGGTGYTTVAGTFAITWNGLGIMTMQMAA